MARNLIDIDTLVPITSFADIATASPVIHGVPEADWNVTAFGAIKIWSNVAVDDAQRSSIGAIWLENITSGSISIRTAIRGLRLAMSLKSTNPANVVSLIASQIRVPDDPEVVAIPNTDDFVETPFTLRSSAQQVMLPGPPAQADPETMKRTAYCFLAAYLMRLIVKAPENVVSGLPNMKLRFKSFYGTSRLVARFNVTLAQASAYKQALLSQSLIALTYTHALAYTHQNIYHELDAKDGGVLHYLGILPFSYTGMHAYTLMMELKEFTQVSLDKLLTLFYVNITAPALNKIAQIERVYERTSEHPTRDITFRYCTLWGPQYFASIRSRNCPHLLYTVAHAWKSLAAGHQNSDPERIAAVNVLPEVMKKIFKRAGESIGESLKQNMKKRIRSAEGEESMKIILAGGSGSIGY